MKHYYIAATVFIPIDRPSHVFGGIKYLFIFFIIKLSVIRAFRRPNTRLFFCFAYVWKHVNKNISFIILDEVFYQQTIRITIS